METKQLIYSEKTKDIHRQPNGNLLIVFKDHVTGANGVVDPGANTVIGSITGKGRMSLEITNHFFKILHDNDIPTHFVSIDLENSTMEAKEAQLPGKDIGAGVGLEFICRLMAYGSFLKRYQKCIKEELKNLDYLVEVTLKDDDRGDPLINDDAVAALGLLTTAQLKQAKDLVRQITILVEKDLREHKLALVDIKMEFGLINNEIVLIDELSADSMRVMEQNGKVLAHEELYGRLLTSTLS